MAELSDFVVSKWKMISADLPDVAGQALERSSPTLERTIDHAALRAAQLAVAGFVVAFLAALVLARRRRARQT